jgi:kynurenine formamidase
VQIVDLTRPLNPDTPVVPGDPRVTFNAVAEHETEGYQVSKICLGSHSGTHLDVPLHFFPGGHSLSDYALSRFVSQGVVLDVRSAAEGLVDAALLTNRLRQNPVKSGEFVLLWTAETAGWLTLDAARLLVDLKVGLVGTDGPSLDLDSSPSESADFAIHRLLLGSDVLIAENLVNLDLLGAGRVRCVFLPLPLTGLDGSPVRATAWKLETTCQWW